MARPHLGSLAIGTLTALAVIAAAWFAFGPRPPRAPQALQSIAKPALPHSDTARDPAWLATSPGAVGHEPSTAAPPPTATSTTAAVRDRQRADQLREALAAMYAGQLSAGGAPAAPATPPLPDMRGPGNPAAEPLDHYVRDVMQDQFVPLAASCYEQLLERQAGAAGTVMLKFSIMGNAALGGVVIDVELGAETTLRDAAFATCVTETMYSVIFAAPPEGHPTVSVTQSFELAP